MYQGPEIVRYDNLRRLNEDKQLYTLALRKGSSEDELRVCYSCLPRPVVRDVKNDTHDEAPISAWEVTLSNERELSPSE